MENGKSGVSNNSTRIAALVIATLANFLTPFMSSAINIAVPAIGAEFAADAIILSWIPTSFLLAAAMFAVPFGRIADIHGMKKIFNYGVVIFTVASLLSALAPSVVALLIFRILQGIGGAMIFVTGLAIITSAFPPQERGKAIGINLASVYIGLSLGPVLGGFLTQYFGWRSLFYSMIPLGVLIIVISTWKLKDEWAVCKGEKFDFAFSNLAALINYSATFAVVFLLSLYLQYIKGFPADYAGLILIVQPVLMAVLSPFAGRLSDKFEAQIIASAGMGLCTIGLAFFAFIDANTSITFIMIGLSILGIGFAFFSSPNTSAIMGSVQKKFYGVASAMVSTMRLVGQMLSMGVALMAFSLFIGQVQITPAQYPGLLHSIHVVFIICTVMCLVGIFASLARGKTHNNG
ncbi:MAG: MFS transporter [Methanobacterium paludis]|nr:MFS transporter [Methanobacterium paludis]